MKVLEHQHDYEYYPGRTVTVIFPFIRANGNEKKLIDAHFGTTTAGFIVVDEASGEIQLQYDSEWLWEPNWWTVGLYAKFAAGIAKAAELSKHYAHQ